MKCFFLVLSAFVSMTAMAASKAPVQGVDPETRTRVVEYYEAGQADLLSGGDRVPVSEIHGAALRRYRQLERSANCTKYGYCPKALMENADDVIVLKIVLSDDGGFEVGLYADDGRAHIATCQASESGPCHWTP